MEKGVKELGDATRGSEKDIFGGEWGLCVASQESYLLRRAGGSGLLGARQWKGGPRN